MTGGKHHQHNGGVQKRQRRNKKPQPPRRRQRKVSYHGGGSGTSSATASVSTHHHPHQHPPHQNRVHVEQRHVQGQGDANNPLPPPPAKYDDVERGDKPCGRGMDDGLPSAHLRTLLDRERQVLPRPACLPKGAGVIGWTDRNREVAWICAVGRRLCTEIDVVSLAVSIFDKAVTTIRVPMKYANCMSAACVYMARKLLEDDEDEAWRFIDKLQLSYSPNELKRMELSVLGALNWDALLPSVERFVSLLLEMAGGACLLGAIRPHIEAVLQDSNIVCEYSPSLVALSIVSHVLEATSKQWLPATQQLLRMTKNEAGLLVACRDRVAATWRRAVVPRLSAFSLLAPFEDGNNAYESSLHERSPSPPHVSESPEELPPLSITSPRLQATPC